MTGNRRDGLIGNSLDFFHFALQWLELEEGESTEGKRKRKGGTSHGKRVWAVQ